MGMPADQICCDCAGFDGEWMYKCAKHGTWYCRGCSCTYCDEDDRDYDDGYDFYEDDPPLYRDGRIAGMSNEELIQEARRQCSIHDSAVDRCVEMGSPIIENAAARLNICSAECKRREIEWLWPDDFEGDTTGEPNGLL